MNFKNLLVCGVAALTCLGAWAVPAKPGVRTFRQADGSAISLRLIGDEYFHTFITTDGLSVSRQSDGNFYYRGTDGISAVIAHNAAERTSDETEYIKANAASLQSSALRAKALSAKGARKAPARAAGSETRQVPCIGSPRVPILLVQYADYKFKDADPNHTFTEFFTSGEKSAYQYFVDQSNGKYTPQFEVYGPITLSGRRSTYGGNDFYGNDKGVGKMVAEGCLGLDGDIDFSRYDNDGDGECDVVIVLYAGDGEASSYESDAENAVWPMQWQLSSSDYRKSLDLDNTTVDRFAVFNELNGSDLNRIDGIGTFCHEFSHCLDLPDYYDTGYGPHFGMGCWSLMHSGNYNDDGYTPLGYSAYEKEFMGWIEIEEGRENTLYILPVMNQKNIDTDKAVRLTNPNDPDEYYIIENRACQGWDEFMPAEGLLIYHVTYDATAWEKNTVNDYDLQRMTPIPADNSLKLDVDYIYGQTYYEINKEDLVGDLWPYGDACELTDTSTPAATVNTGSFMGKPVTEMTRNADGTISFWVMKTPLPQVAAPLNPTHKVESPTSVTISWEPGDLSEATYTVELRQHRDITYELVSSTDFTSAAHGWTTDGFTETTASGTRLGSSNKLGAVTSPQFSTASDGLVTVKFDASYYSNDGSSVSVCLLDDTGMEILSEVVELTARPASYTVVFEANADSPFKVMFQTLSTKKRVYITRADIYTGDASDAGGSSAVDDVRRTVSGIDATSVLIDDLPEYGTFDYRVKAVPADKENYSDSPWTDFGMFALSDNSSAASVEVAARSEYYTLQGFRLSGKPAVAGLYIERCGNRVRKVLITE